MLCKSFFFPLLTPVIALTLLTACIRPEPKNGTPTPPTATVTATVEATATTEATATAESTATTAPTATSEPTATAADTATPIPTPTEVADEALAPELAGIVAASIGLTTTQPITDALGIAGVQAVKLDNPTGSQPLWLAYTYGLRNFETKQNHLIAIYTRQNGGWQEVARQEFANESQAADDFAPDYVDQNGVRQAAVEPQHIWIEIHGGVGAHSGVYGLFSFDGTQFTKQVTNFTASPGGDKLEDLNGDGTLEAVLDATDYYVFCYACGVRYVQHEIRAWDGAKMTPVMLAEIPSTTAGDVGDLNHQLLQLAQHGLWKDALAFLTQHTPLPSGNATFDWNVIYVRLNAEAKRAEMENSPYPLLTELFYGDLPATVDHLRQVGADGIFIANSPLISGTVAEGWDEQMAGYITRTVEPLLDDQINAPLAYFLHGWATYLQTKDLAAALPDVQKAAALAPDDKFFAKSVDFLTPHQGVAQLTTLVNLNVRSAPGTKATQIGRLPVNTVAQITGRTPDGQELWWQIVYPAGSNQRGWVSGNPQFSKAENTEQTPVVK